LCWMALNSSNPGKAFTEALLSLGDLDISPMVNWSAIQICESFGINSAKVARSMRVKAPEIREHQLHKLLSPYFDIIEQENDVESFLQRMMHPGQSPRPSSKIKLTDLLPPLAIYADNAYQLNGPWRDRGWAVAEPLIRLSSIIVETLTWIDERMQEMV